MGNAIFFVSQFVEKSDDEVRFVGQFPDALVLVLHAAAAAGGGMLQANGEGRRACQLDSFFSITLTK